MVRLLVGMHNLPQEPRRLIIKSMKQLLVMHQVGTPPPEYMERQLGKAPESLQK